MNFSVTGAASTRFQPVAETPPVAAASSSSPLRNSQLLDKTPYLANLTATDLELIHQATGVRLDENSKTFPMMAVDVAMDRQVGALKPGEPISVDYLTDLLKRYEASGVEQQAEQARRAIEYLAQRGGAPGVDLNA